MSRFARWMRHFLDNEDGPTAVEYAIMLALVLIAVVTIVGTLGNSTSRAFSTTAPGFSTISAHGS